MAEDLIIVDDGKADHLFLRLNEEMNTPEWSPVNVCFKGKAFQ